MHSDLCLRNSSGTPLCEELRETPVLHTPAIQHVPFLNFICLVIAQPSYFSVSLQGLPAFKWVNSSPQFSTICRLAFLIPSSPASKVFMKMLKNTGPKMQPCRFCHNRSNANYYLLLLLLFRRLNQTLISNSKQEKYPSKLYTGFRHESLCHTQSPPRE